MSGLRPLVAAVDWATVSSLATAGGTLVLAVATFVSVRSAHRATRAAERALLVSLRPVLVPTRMEDPAEKVGFVDDHWVQVAGGRASVEVTADVIYLAVPLRNVGNGLAVLDRWHLAPAGVAGVADHGDVDGFRRLTRDLYVPAGDQGFWQGALRDPAEPAFAELRAAVERRERLTLELLYGDHEGGQRTITRFSFLPAADGGWLATAGRYWYLDHAGPR
jgi:hypothetical protein